MTTEKAKKEIWLILHSLTINQSVSIAQIITDNDKNIVSQKQKDDGFCKTLPGYEQSQVREARQMNEEGVK